MKITGLKITADDIVAYLQKKQFNQSATLGVTEFCINGGSSKRIDLFYFNRWDRETRGYEIKVSRADFLADKKWQSYLPYCSWFYFIAPEGIIKPEELPDGVGLMEITVEDRPEWSRPQVEDNDFMTSYFLDHKFTKKGKKLHEIGEKEYTSLLEGLLIKLVYSNNIVFKPSY